MAHIACCVPAKLQSSAWRRGSGTVSAAAQQQLPAGLLSDCQLPRLTLCETWAVRTGARRATRAATTLAVHRLQRLSRPSCRLRFLCSMQHPFVVPRSHLHQACSARDDDQQPSHFVNMSVKQWAAAPGRWGLGMRTHEDPSRRPSAAAAQDNQPVANNQAQAAVLSTWGSR